MRFVGFFISSSPGWPMGALTTVSLSSSQSCVTIKPSLFAGDLPASLRTLSLCPFWSHPASQNQPRPSPAQGVPSTVWASILSLEATSLPLSLLAFIQPPFSALPQMLSVDTASSAYKPILILSQACLHLPCSPSLSSPPAPRQGSSQLACLPQLTSSAHTGSSPCHAHRGRLAATWPSILSLCSSTSHQPGTASFLTLSLLVLLSGCSVLSLVLASGLVLPL